MDKKEFIKEIEKIEIAYKKQFTQEELKMWYEEFKSTDKTEFTKAIDRAIKECKFIPKISEIRARISVNPVDYFVNDKYRYLYKNLEWGQFVN